jgi:beta-glucosidase
MLTTVLLSFALQAAPETRAAELVAKMTTEEKIGQLMMDAPAIPRLGVPAYHWWNEALHGIARNGVATVFPQAIGLAATWDTDLMHRVATVISTEARAKNNQNPRGIYHGLTLWSPNVNIFRDPRWGRGHETYGEDPFLTGSMGVAFVTGIQGDGPILRAVATPKHFAVHSGPEPLRHQFDAKTPERDIFETYLPQFEMCVREGHAQSVMAAYSGFNGVPATGNPWLLTDLLRKTWGFDGAVVSDVDSVADLWQGHKIAKDAAEASAMALKAGDDLCSGTTYRALPEALRRGLISVSDLDRAATRLFTLRYRLGMFDKNPYQEIPASEIDSSEHDALNFETAKKSLVLLKNDGVLPLKPSVRRIAVIGPTADDLSTLVGNYNGEPSHPVTILAGIRRRFESDPKAFPFSPRGPQGQVTYAKGCALAESLDDGRGPFPRGSVTTDASFIDAGPNLPGWTREVFQGRDLQGATILKGVTNGVNMRWSPPNSPQGIPATNVSIRWTGTFTPPETGNATFGLSADDGMRLYVDDKLVIDDWTQHAETLHTAKVPLVKGKPVRLRVEYFQAEQDASVRLGISMENPKSDPELAEALEAARNADAVVLTLGITPNLEGEEMNVNAAGFKGGDRTAIELPKPQRELMAAIKKLGKPTVLVLTGGSALAFDPSGANAILDQWYSGGRGGDAVAGAIFGDFSPAGRLPVTFYRSTKDLPAFENYAMAGRTYRYFGGKPLFPFGHGLSYTKFAYGRPSVRPLGIVPGNTWQVSVPVSNVGGYDGEEVVQLYAHPTKRQPGDARRSLVGFARVSIPKGTAKTATFTLLKDRLRVWDPAQRAYVVRPGEYVLEVGASSSDIRGTAKISL